MVRNLVPDNGAIMIEGLADGDEASRLAIGLNNRHNREADPTTRLTVRVRPNQGEGCALYIGKVTRKK